MKRSKLDAFDISIEGLDVWKVFLESRGLYIPVLKNSSKTLFSLVATTSLLIGSPIMRAICPAQIFPKFPVGTVKLTTSFFLVTAR